jgi:UDP-N-acetylmuramoyl-L-alanyl-D-glutamate--2,6-diaminopimelate ligase
VCHFVASALDGEVGDRGGCGIIGTLGQGRPGALRGGGLTTPDALTTHRALADLYAAGCERVAMEVSSHALDQRRLAGVRFSTAVFTNLSRDHLDYHGSMAEYARAKARLFAWPGLQSAVINRDDAHGRVLAGSLSQDVRLITYGTGPTRGLRGEHLVGRVMGLTADGLELAVDGVFGRGVVRARLAGRFNALNLLAAVGTLVAEGIELQQVLARLGAARAVPGRMEPFGGSRGRPLVVVDYAHTPDALGQALESLRDQCRGRLCCVFGCGGDRDAGKRPAMGAVAARLADALVLTDDNPRGENGDQIVDAILRGMPAGARVTVERDRAAAICLAVTAAGADDAVLVAGKGHETVQEVAGVRRPFSDAAAVRAALGEGAP